MRPSTQRLVESARASNAQRRNPGKAAPPSASKGAGGDRKRILMFVGGGVGGLIVLVLLVTQVFGGGGGGSAKQPATNAIESTPATTKTAASKSTEVNRATTTVAILNGTTFQGLASGVANQIENAGFKRGEVTNAADQTRSATIVEYTDGNKPAALEVANTIGAGSDAVVPISDGSRVLAPSAQVVVTVGSDQSPTTG